MAERSTERDELDSELAEYAAALRTESETGQAEIDRVMSVVRTRPLPRRRLRPRWLMAAGLALAAAVIFGVALRTGEVTVSPETGPSTVRFAFVAPEVEEVALVGDFNTWDPGATPMRRDPHTGSWVADVPLPAGRYTYSYIVDGATWVADPLAALAPEDDFGSPSSVIVVGKTLGAS